MELFATKEEIFEDKKTGEIQIKIKYFVYHPEIGVKIYLKPVDKTAEEILKFLAYDNKIKKILD